MLGGSRPRAACVRRRKAALTWASRAGKSRPEEDEPCVTEPDTSKSAVCLLAVSALPRACASRYLRQPPLRGEVTGLRWCDLDLVGCTVRISAALIERSTGELVLGPPKSERAGFPRAILPALEDRLALFVGLEPGALPFAGVKDGPMWRSNFNKLSGWPHAVVAVRADGLHFDDLRHTGNHRAATSGAALRDLMARMGHDSERAKIYQHQAVGADQAITAAIKVRSRQPGQMTSPARLGRRRPAIAR